MAADRRWSRDTPVGRATGGRRSVRPPMGLACPPTRNAAAVADRLRWSRHSGEARRSDMGSGEVRETRRQARGRRGGYHAASLSPPLPGAFRSIRVPRRAFSCLGDDGGRQHPFQLSRRSFGVPELRADGRPSAGVGYFHRFRCQLQRQASPPAALVIPPAARVGITGAVRCTRRRRRRIDQRRPASASPAAPNITSEQHKAASRFMIQPP